jgi:hypothetical protein
MLPDAFPLLVREPNHPTFTNSKIGFSNVAALASDSDNRSARTVANPP